MPWQHVTGRVVGEKQLNLYLRTDFPSPDERVSANAVPLMSALLRRIS